MEGEQEVSRDYPKDHPMMEESATEAADIWDENATPYEWDHQEDTPDSEPTLVYHSSVIWIPPGSGIMTKHTHDIRFLEHALPPNRRKARQLSIAAASIDKSVEPVYHHRSRQKSAV
jgi:hypothetical protein